MEKRKAYTLVELMAVIIVIIILAVLMLPMLQGRIDAAKWSEGKALMGVISEALRVYIAEKGRSYINFDDITIGALGFIEADLTGTYFGPEDFQWTGNYNMPRNEIFFMVIAFAPDEINSPSMVTVNQDGKWVEIP
jgi:type II secretory pathway pseudopilin PulG